MAHSPRYEARLETAWRDLAASVDALRAELKAAPTPSPPQGPGRAARALREPGLRRLPLVKAILAELRTAGRGTSRR